MVDRHWVSRRITTTAGVVALALPSVATAQQADDRDRVVTIGLGVQVAPRHLGDDGYKVFPMPYGEIRRPGAPRDFSAGDDNPSIALIRTENFSIGPTLNFRARRKELNVGAPVGNIGMGIEPGVFVEAYPVSSVRVRADARIGINGHDGFVGDVAVDYVMRSADNRLVAGFGPRLRWGDGAFERRYFGVTPAVSARTGLAPFAPDGGIHAVGVQAAGHYELSDRWGVYATAGIDRLVGAGKESPIISTHGSTNQFYAGLSATYTFDLRL